MCAAHLEQGPACDKWLISVIAARHALQPPAYLPCLRRVFSTLREGDPCCVSSPVQLSRAPTLPGGALGYREDFSHTTRMSCALVRVI